MSQILEKAKKLRQKLKRYFPGITVFLKGVSLIYSKRSYLNKSGYIKSIKLNKPVKQDGSPIPWMNYNIISFLEQRLTGDLCLFEYGSGNSTLFFASHVKSVTSVECDRLWYEYISKTIPDNVTLILCNPYNSEDYSQIIKRQNRKFDIIVVDAEDRVNCLISAQQYLSEKGIIILDDSQNEEYNSTADQLRKQGFKRLDFEGLKPGRISCYRTTILYKNNNCLGI